MLVLTLEPKNSKGTNSFAHRAGDGKSGTDTPPRSPSGSGVVRLPRLRARRKKGCW
jgi:hypothetical protein